ncbi:hypothetical protein [Phenylobacterium sp.]|uniref:hypothetical protein n=1 Tax=Phenylobacterium sp. TaxID=1871053 RepID=UPI0011F90817|nr:hypothetical protein [Phenylobacterium sp.]THD64789.1 MAG: hypothetical protein E8A49_01705 [Phenylobacterium sp.]
MNPPARFRSWPFAGLLIGAGLLSPADPLAAAPDAPSGAPARIAGLGDVFLPSPQGPDFVVTYLVKRGWGTPGDDTATVSRSGGWLRVDKIENHHAGTTYIGAATSVVAELGRDDAGRYRALQVYGAAHAPSPGIQYDPRKTGASDTVLGEPCEVWSVYRQPPDRVSKGFERTGCVTGDGIELWRKTAGGFGELSSARAVSVERRAVSPGGTHPPADLLDLRAWGVAAVTGPAAAPDFEVVLAPDGQSHLAPMTVRRHGGWMYEDRSDYSGMRMLFSHRLDNAVMIGADFDAAGQPKRLSIERRAPSTGPSLGAPMAGKVGTVLGEPCAWVDAMPLTYDAGRSECRAADGAPLRIVFTMRGGDGFGYTATRVSRRRLTLAQVLPSRDLLAPKAWGLRD